MEKVLARRDENWKKLQQYILDERGAASKSAGPSNLPVWGEKREYSWFIQDGFFVRSPVKANGVDISDADRRKYEEKFLRRMKERDKRASAASRRRRPDRWRGRPSRTRRRRNGPTNLEAFLSQTRQPRSSTPPIS